MFNLRNYFKAAYPAILVLTAEEQRARRAICEQAHEVNKFSEIFVWSAVDGFINLSPGMGEAKIPDSEEILSALKSRRTITLYILQDLHLFGIRENPVLNRALRDMISWAPRAGSCIVLLSPFFDVPPEIEHSLTTVEFELPNNEEIEAILEGVLASLKESKKEEIALDNGVRQELIQSAKGLSTIEVENAYFLSYIEQGSLDPLIIQREKVSTLKRSTIFELLQTETLFSDIGGLDELKEWVRKRDRAYSKQAREFGLDPPRGILLIGPPGAGKSLAAKAVGSVLGLPTLRVDFGKLFGPMVGESLHPDEELIILQDRIARRMKISEAFNRQVQGKVISFSSDLKAEIKPILTCLRHKRTKPMVQITTKSGREIRVTEDHSVFSISPEGNLMEVKPSDLKEGSPIATPNFQFSGSLDSLDLLELIQSQQDESQWGCENASLLFTQDELRGMLPPKSISGFLKRSWRVPLKNLPYHPADMRLGKIHSSLSESFPRTIKISKNLAEILGWISAEGSFSHSYQRIRLSIHQKEVSHLSSLLSSENLSFSIYPDRKSQGRTLFIGKGTFGTILKLLKFDEKRVPAFIFQLRDELRHSYLRGVFSGDGNFSQGRSVELGSSKLPFLQDVQLLLSLSRIRSQIYPHKKHQFRLSISAPTMVSSFFSLIGFAQKHKNPTKLKADSTCQRYEIPIFDRLRIAEKQFRRSAYKNKTKSFHFVKKRKWLSLKNARKLLPEIESWDVFFDRVEKIIQIPDQPEFVYDIAVADNQNFISGKGGIICHNSERLTRQMIQTAEAIAPTVCFWDEIEKGLAGSSGRGELDSGTTRRVFGTVLTWMQERKPDKPVFIVATSNDVNALPPEFLRKGRFDEIFAVDLPTESERKEIFEIHLKKRKREPKMFDLPKLIQKSSDFTGSEIEEAIISALYDAFDEGSDLQTRHIEKSLSQTVSLAVSQKDRIEEIRKLIGTKVRAANKTEKKIAARKL
jgi:SpoVK/Ycf46/Vps4 family AAA+-type ATPase/intein/homing endonuclease